MVLYFVALFGGWGPNYLSRPLQDSSRALVKGSLR